MKTMYLKNLIAGTFLVLSAWSADAAPTVRAVGNQTSVSLSTELVAALTSLDVTPGAVFPGVLRKNGVAFFPIPRAEIDAANAKGEVIHLGGLFLETAATRVELTQFIIDTSVSSGPVLTGLVKVNDSVVGRLPLFNVTLPALSLPLDVKRKLFIGNAALKLTAEAAQALNTSFGVNAFSAGFPIGTAGVSMKIERSKSKS